MSELKTLKDLELRENFTCDEWQNWRMPFFKVEDQIRQEAIKWVKELDSNIVRIGGVNDKDCLHCGKRLDMPGNQERLHTISFIKHFFNIEESELE